MSIRVYLAALLCAVVASVQAAPLSVTNVTWSGSNVRLEWNNPTNRFIIEEVHALGGKWVCSGTSVGVTATRGLVPAPAVTTSFYRVHFGLQAVPFLDAKFEKEVRKKITSKLAPTNRVYDVEMWPFTTLDFSFKSITNITGIANAVHVQTLNLNNNAIRDTSPMIGLNSLTYLSLTYNRVTVPVLTGTPNLTELYLGSNGIANVSFVSGLTKLQKLYLPSNPISSTSALSSLTGLQYLDLSICGPVNNLSALSGLTALKMLDLSYTSITNLDALVTNAQAGGLGSGDAVYVTGCTHLSSYAVNTEIPLLKNTYKVTVLGP